MKLRHDLFLIFFALLLALSACSKDDNAPESGTGGETPLVIDSAAFTCDIDGVSFVSQVGFLNGSSGFSGIFGWGASGGYIANDEIKIITLSLSSPNENSFQVDTTFDGANSLLEDYFSATLHSSSDSLGIFEGSSAQSLGAAICTITAIDTVAEIFSGTFSFDVYDPNLDSTQVISSGVFTNLEYN